MSTLIDDFNQKKMTNNNTYSAPSIVSPTTAEPTQNNVVKPKNKKLTKVFNKLISKASIKRLVKLFKSKRTIFALVAIVILSVPVLAIINSWSNADTGTQTIYPNADYGTLNNFAQTGGSPTAGNHCAAGTHCNYIDFNDSANTTYVGTGLTMDTTTAEEEYDFTDLSIDGTLTQVTSVTVTVKARIITLAGGGTNADGLNVRLYIDGAYNGTTNGATMSTTESSHTFTWNNLTAATASDIRVEIVRVANGTGGGTAKDDDFRIYEVKTSVNYAYSPNKPMLSLEGYTFENDDSTSPDALSTIAGNSFSSGKTLSSVRQGERITLRANISNSGGPLPSTTELGLFYDRGDGIWAQVKNQQLLRKSSGSGCGGSGSIDWTCSIVDNDSDNTGSYTSLAISPDGTPYIAYYDATALTLMIAKYVGSGGSGCGTNGSSEWTCTTIDSDADGLGWYISLAFSPDGTPYISYRDTVGSLYALKVAKYVGSGGIGCGGSSAWTCTTVYYNNSQVGPNNYTSIAISPSGIPYVSFRFGHDPQILMVAKYVGSGGNGCGSGGSSAWTCTSVDTKPYSAIYSSFASYSSIAFSPGGIPYVSYAGYDIGNRSTLMVAKYVGSNGTGCGGSSAWSCTTVDNETTRNTGAYTSIAFTTGGMPYVSYRDTTATSLRLAKYVGSGGNGCGSGGSSEWTCISVDDDTVYSTGAYTSLAFSPDGTPFIGYYDSSATSLRLAKYVGSNGSGCGNSGSSEWTCTTIDDDTDSTGSYLSLAFSQEGSPYVSYWDYTQNALAVARAEKSGEIQFSSSLAGLGSRTISTSHADMTSSNDATNRDNANCLISATWNNGILAAGSTIGGFTIPNGGSTKQCTELAWTIDTSQAIPGATYRFMIASKDSFRPDKGVWRGPVSVATDAYPTLTIMPASEQSYKYSKDVTFANLSSDCGPGGSSDWTCSTIKSSVNTASDGSISLAYSQDGTPYISYYKTSAPQGLGFAKYEGSSGSNCTSSAWTCTEFISSGTNVGTNSSIAFAPDGRPSVAYENSNTYTLYIANYVGVGNGSGCTSSAWTCTAIDNFNVAGEIVDKIVIKYDSNGNPLIAYSANQSVGSGSLKIAQYVGSNGTGCASTTAWTCTLIENNATNKFNLGGLALSQSGSKFISYQDVANTSLKIAQYVGSNGTGCASTTAWTCTTIDNDTDNTGGYSDLGITSDGTIYISYSNPTNNAIKTAKYVGGSSGGGCGVSGSTAWLCSILYDSPSGTNRGTVTISPENIPYITFNEESTRSMMIAKYVGSNGIGCGSSEWSCSTVQNSLSGSFIGNRSSSAFALDGSLSFAYSFITNLKFAKMKLSEFKPNMTVNKTYNGKDAGSGSGRYWLNSGTAPYGNWQGFCGGNQDLYGYCGLYKNDGQYDSLNAQIGERPLYNISTKFSSNNTTPTVKIYFKSSVSPSDSNVIVQAYRFGSTNAWETVKTFSTSGCTTGNCYIEAMPSGAASEYFEQKGSDYWVYFRVFQNESYSSGITFKLDMFRADQPQVLMRHGRVFRENLKDPFTFQR